MYSVVTRHNHDYLSHISLNVGTISIVWRSDSLR